MAAGEASRIIRAPGRIVVGPTNLSAAYPYGGTEIGLTRMCILAPQGNAFRVTCEGLGGEASDVLYRVNQWLFSFLLRGWDDDAVRLLWPGRYSAGAVSRHAMLKVPGTALTGGSMLGSAVRLLYVPDDVVNIPSVLVYRGVPDWGVNAEVAFQRREEVALPVAVDCLRDTNGHTIAIGRFADLSLTA